VISRMLVLVFSDSSVYLRHVRTGPLI